jgi:hypothetical protein
LGVVSRTVLAIDIHLRADIHQQALHGADVAHARNPA